MDLESTWDRTGLTPSRTQSPGIQGQMLKVYEYYNSNKLETFTIGARVPGLTAVSMDLEIQKKKHQ